MAKIHIMSARLWRNLRVYISLVLLATMLWCYKNPIMDVRSQSQILLKPSTTITLWYSYPTGGSEENALNLVIADALIQFPGLAINAVQVNFGDLPSSYESEVRAGGGPDLVLYPNDELGNHARAGLVQNLDSYLLGQLSNYSQIGIDGMTVGGHLYGVPESSKAVALFYNTSMLPTPPATTGALLAEILGGTPMSNLISSYHPFGWFGAFGGQLLDPSNRCIADEGGFVEAMQFLLDLQAAGAAFTEDYNQAQQDFLDGLSAMFVNGPWALADYKTELGSDLGVAIMPSGPAGPALPLTGIDGFYVNPNSLNMQEAVDLALFMTNQGSSQVMMDEGGHIPVRTDVTITDPLVATFAQAADQGLARPQVAELANYWSPFQQMVIDVLSGFVSPTEGVQTACDAMNAANPYLLLIPGSGNTINLTGYPTYATVDIPSGAVSTPITLTYSILSPDQPTIAPFDMSPGGLFFDLSAYDNSGPLYGFGFNSPITITVNYDTSDVQGIFPEISLRLFNYDIVTNSWLDAAESCTPASIYLRDIEVNTLQVGVCHLSRFGLFGKVEKTVYLPFLNR